MRLSLLPGHLRSAPPFAQNTWVRRPSRQQRENPHIRLDAFDIPPRPRCCDKAAQNPSHAASLRAGVSRCTFAAKHELCSRKDWPTTVRWPAEHSRFARMECGSKPQRQLRLLCTSRRWTVMHSARSARILGCRSGSSGTRDGRPDSGPAPRDRRCGGGCQQAGEHGVGVGVVGS